MSGGFDAWQLAALAAALGWASGVRLYVVLFALGLAARLGLVTLPPGLAPLAHGGVIAAAGFMLAVEFLADKVPGVDSLWDAVHTFVRLPAGAALAAGAFADAPAAATLAAAIAGGSLAAGGHLAKAGARAAINASPEPFSNWTMSFAEDAGVLVLLWLAFAHPFAALAVVAALLALAVWLLPRLFRALRGGFARLAGLARGSRPGRAA